MMAKNPQLSQNDEAIKNGKKLVKTGFQMRTHVEESISPQFSFIAASGEKSKYRIQGIINHAILFFKKFNHA